MQAFGRGRALAAGLAVLILAVSVSDADARRRPARTPKSPAENGDSVSGSGRYAAYVVDAKTGRVLFSRNADAPRFPASLTKMMTLYVLFEDLERGKVKLDTTFEVSARAAAQSPSKLGLRPGQTIEVEDAIKAIVTRSANDIAVVIAENVAGSEEEFANRMTRTARRIGMSGSVFRNASGLPNSQQVTTAEDMVTLGRALQDRFPDYYTYFSTRRFVFRGEVIGNHNRLLGRIDGVDGIKTGYTQASGFNLVSSVRRDGRHVVAAVLGGPTAGARDAHMARLIETYLPAASRGPKTDMVADRGEDAPAKARPPAKIASAEVAVALTKPDERPPLERGAAVAMAKAILLPEASITEPAPRPAPRVVAAATAPAGYAAPPPAPVRKAATDVVSGYAPVSGVGGFLPPALVGAPVAPPAPTLLGAKPAAAEPKRAEAPAVDTRTASLAPQPPREVDPTTTRSVTPRPDAQGAPRGGWMIQIGAVESEESAKSLLAKAKGSAGGALGAASPFTETVTKGSATIWRARFAGFVDQSAADQACRSLKRKDFQCLALRQ